ncbi:hypothetical protein HAX54_019515, partial [Datura stramonium]|nr:hypothetical protein [Datura stramonium]
RFFSQINKEIVTELPHMRLSIILQRGLDVDIKSRDGLATYRDGIATYEIEHIKSRSTTSEQMELLLLNADKRMNGSSILRTLSNGMMPSLTARGWLLFSFLASVVKHSPQRDCHFFLARRGSGRKANLKQ